MNDTILPAHFAPRVPIVGTLKIGDVVGSKAVKLGHMRLCTASATGDNRYDDHPDMKEFNSGKNTSIEIELVSDDPRVNLDIVYNMGGNGFIVCRGNGTTAERRLMSDGKISSEAAFQKLPDGKCGEACPYYQSGKCKLASTLYFRIPGKTAIGSVWQFRTKAWNTAQDLLGAMQSLKDITGGVLARMPLTVFMTEQKRRPVQDSKRVTSHFWTLGLAFNGDEEQLIQAVSRARRLARDMRELAMPSIEERLKSQPSELLEDLDEAEERAFCAEFCPEENQPASKMGDEPPQQFDNPEWTDEDIASAKAMLPELGERLMELGVSELDTKSILADPDSTIGLPYLSFNTWTNRFLGYRDRKISKYSKASQ